MNTMCYRCMRNTGVNGFCTVCGQPIRSQREIGDDYLLPLGTHLDEDNVIVGEKLGRGGFGITYVALDTKQWGVVALKEFVPFHMISSMRRNNAIYVDEQWWSDYRKHMSFFRGEAQTLAKLDHPNIVKVYFEFEENNTCYYGMQLLKGRNLHEWFRDRGPLSAADALHLMDPLLDALEYIHAQNVLHRDISPANIFLRDDPSRFMGVDPCLIDFGASYDAHVAFSKSAPHIKTKGFSPPEQNAGRDIYGPHSDVYAITAVIYYLVTGQTPPPSEDRMFYGAELQEPARLSKDVPQGFSDAIMHGMHLDREQRIQTVRDLRRELGEGLKKHKQQEGSDTDKRDSGDGGTKWPPPPTPRPSRDPRPLRGLLGSLFDTAIFGLIWYGAMSWDVTRDLVDGNLWIAGLGCLVVAMLVNLMMTLFTGGTLGECIAGYPEGRMESDKAVFHAVGQTIYPFALMRKLTDLLAAPSQASKPETDTTINPPPSNAGPHLVPGNPGDRRIKERRYELKPSGQILGRWANEKTTCDMPISDSMCVSRIHCAIAYDRQWYVEDRGSKNGTFVNGQRIPEGRRMTLTEGTRVSLGDEGIELIFHEH